MAMCGNGAVIGMNQITVLIVKQIQRVLVRGLLACIVAVAGTAVRGVVALQVAAAATRRVATAL